MLFLYRRYMSIIRTLKNKENPYAMIAKDTIQNKKLSWKAKGILAYLLSLPDDWVIYVSELEKHAPDGEASLRSGMKELLDAGYLVREQKRNEEGKFIGYDYVAIEDPAIWRKSQNGKDKKEPYSENPHTVFPHVDNQGLLINDSTKHESKKKSVNQPSEIELLELFEDLTGRYRPAELISPYEVAKWEKEVGKWEREGATAQDVRDAIKKADELNSNLSWPGSITRYINSITARRKRGYIPPEKNPVKRKGKQKETVDEMKDRLMPGWRDNPEIVEGSFT